MFDVELEGVNLKKELVQGKNTNAYDNSIRAIMADAKTDCDYDIESGHRFFCGKMVSTNYQKISPGGIQGARFINLREALGSHGDIEDIASKLSKATWE